MADLDLLLGKERERADLAIQAGKDPVAVNGMYLQQAKKLKIDNGVDPYKAEWDTAGEQMKLAVQAGKDPKAAQELYNQYTTHLSIERMLQPDTKTLGGKVAAGFSGLAKGVSKLSGNVEVAIGRLAQAIGIDPEGKAAQAGRDYLKEVDQKYESDPFVKENPQIAMNFDALGTVAAAGALPTGPTSMGAGALGMGKYVAGQTAGNAALGAATAGEGNYATGAAVGGLLGGGLAAAIGGASKGVESLAAKSMAPELRANQSRFKELGVDPTFAQASPSATVKRAADTLSQFPGSGGVGGITATENLQKGVQTAINNVDPKDSISFINKLDPEGKITSVDGLDEAFKKRIFANPNVAGKELPVSDPEMMSQIKSIIAHNLQNKDLASRPTQTIKRVLDLMKNNSTLEGLDMARKGLDSDARLIRQGASNLPQHEQEAIWQAADIVRQRLNRMSGQLGVGDEWQGYNKWYVQKSDFNALQDAFDKSFNPNNYNEFDANMAFKQFAKLVDNPKFALKTTQAQQVAKGLKEVLPMYRTQVEELKGGLKKSINQVVGSSALGIMGSVTAASKNAASVQFAAGVTSYLTGIRFINKLLNSPRGLKMLQDIGSRPDGKVLARTLSEKIAKTATVLGADELGNQNGQ